MTPQLSRSTDIVATADRVWLIVSDLPRMGAHSPENTGGRWLRGAQGPAVGATFRGANRRGLRRWSTRATVVACSPGAQFSFAVTAGPLPVALWEFTVTATTAGCTLSQHWTDQLGRLLRAVGGALTGEPDRAGFTATSMESTLASVRVLAERR